MLAQKSLENSQKAIDIRFEKKITTNIIPLSPLINNNDTLEKKNCDG